MIPHRKLPMVGVMGDSRAYGAGLGAGSLVAGIASLAFDLPALGLLAGVLGAVVAAWLVKAGTEAATRHETDMARVRELERALLEAWDRAGAAEAALEGMEASPELSPEEVEALIDPVTGLYGERFFEVTLTNRVAAARRHLRPVAVVLVEVAAGVKDGEPVAADAALVSTHVKATLREADTACYLDDARFGLVLEDTPENGAVWTVERVRRALNVDRKDLTLWAGVACYPAHAFDAGELLGRATAALHAAKEWRQDRIEVATTSDV